MRHSFIASKAISRISKQTIPSQTATIEFEEICALCDMSIPQDQAVIRNVLTKQVICKYCINSLIDIFKLELKGLVK